MNTLKKEREQEKSKENHSWLDPSNGRKYMTDKQIQKNIDLEKSCLMEKEKKEVMDMLYKYMEAFSLRDEIGMCPNIEIEIDVMDKYHSLLDLTMSKRKIKTSLIKNWNVCVI